MTASYDFVSLQALPYAETERVFSDFAKRNEIAKQIAQLSEAFITKDERLRLIHRMSVVEARESLTKLLDACNEYKTLMRW
jgi:DNA-nicking Smr family endonuclease